MLYRQRMTAQKEEGFVVFLIGMRINQPWKINQWLPVVRAMPRMLTELYQQPALGLLSHEMWFGRTTLMVQYWRDMPSLLAYAKSRDAQHLPAWRRFNQVTGTNGSVGIWHETYQIQPGGFENIYVNMPAFGLGKAGRLVEVGKGLHTAAERMSADHPSSPI